MKLIIIFTMLSQTEFKLYNLFQKIEDSVPLDSKALRFIPRQISITTQEPKTKKTNRIIFH